MDNQNGNRFGVAEGDTCNRDGCEGSMQFPVKGDDCSHGAAWGICEGWAVKPHHPRKVYCCGCWNHVMARFCSGKEIYPHRPDLSDKVFWKCDTCGNYVGCHRGTARPLGVIPTPELRAARQRVHAVIDHFWKEGRIDRSHLYDEISRRIGNEFHTANMIRVSDADKIIAIANEIMEAQHADPSRS